MVSLLVGLLISMFAWFVGVGLFIGAAFIVPKSLPNRIRAKITRFYASQCVRALWRFLVVVHRHGGVSLAASDPDPTGTEIVKVNGMIQNYDDIADRVDYLFGYPCGLVLEWTDVIVNPIDVAVGKLHDEYVTSGDDRMDFSQIVDDDNPSSRWGLCLGDHVRLPEIAPAVDVRDVLSLIGGDGEPNDIEVVKQYVENSQVGFKSAHVQEYMTLALVAGATALIWFLIFDFRSQVDNEGTVIGIGSLAFDLVGVVF